MRGAKRHLLGFSKKIVRVSVEYQATQHLHGNQLLGDQLGGIKNIKAESLGLLLGKHLNAKVPFRKDARLNPFPQITSVKVRVSTRNFHGFVPYQTVSSSFWTPVKFTKN